MADKVVLFWKSQNFVPWEIFIMPMVPIVSTCMCYLLGQLPTLVSVVEMKTNRGLWSAGWQIKFLNLSGKLTVETSLEYIFLLSLWNLVAFTHFTSSLRIWKMEIQNWKRCNNKVCQTNTNMDKYKWYYKIQVCVALLWESQTNRWKWKKKSFKSQRIV